MKEIDEWPALLYITIYKDLCLRNICYVLTIKSGGKIESNLSWIPPTPLITGVLMSHSIERNNMKMRIAMCIRAEIKQLEGKVKNSNSSKNKGELTIKKVEEEQEEEYLAWL